MPELHIRVKDELQPEPDAGGPGQRISSHPFPRCRGSSVPSQSSATLEVKMKALGLFFKPIIQIRSMANNIFDQHQTRVWVDYSLVQWVCKKIKFHS